MFMIGYVLTDSTIHDDTMVESIPYIRDKSQKAPFSGLTPLKNVNLALTS